MVESTKTRWAFTCALAGLLFCASFLSAQIITGSIGGIVTDATGAVIANAKVTLTSPNLIGGARTITTDASGAYRFLELPPGTYAVRFEQAGFKAYTEQGIVVNTGVQIAVNAKLDLGDVTQEVTVQATAATIDTEHVTSSTVANQAVMEDIPNGRSPWAIGNSVAAVTTSAFDVGGSSGMQQASLTAHGSTTADQKFMIDGISVNWGGGAGGSTLLYYDMGMFQEVNYLIGAVPADVSQGGVYINMITGDGGNQFHGKVFASGASQGMQSNNISPALSTQLLNNLTTTTKSLINLSTVIPGTPITEVYDYNGQLGGPIIKDKLWFFTSWRQWAANNIVSGAFNANGTQALNPNQIDNEMGKFSYQATPKNRFSLMYFRNQKNRYDRRNQGNFGDNVTTVLQNQPGYEWDFKYTYVPTSRWVIDAGFALTAGKTPYRYQNAAPAGALSVYDTSTTEVFNIAQYNYLNPVYRGALDASASYFNSSWGGTHNFKFGFQDYKDGFKQRYTADGDIQGILVNGVPTYAYLYDTPINIQSNNLTVIGLYAEDTWTIKKRLTINYGVRWEEWNGSIPAQTSPAGTYMPQRSYSSIQGPNWKNTTPRFGFSYDLTGKGKTVIKGSASQYMQGEGAGNLVVAFNPLAFGTEQVTWSCPGGGAGTTAAILAANAACTAAGPLPSQINLASGTGFGGGVTSKLDPNITRPRAWEYSFGIQQQLPYNVVFSVMGWYRKTYNQIGTENLAVPSSAYTPYQIANPLTGKMFTFYDEQPAFKGLQNNLITNTNQLDTFYRGIDLDFTRRMNRSWMMLGGVTLGRFNGAWTGDVNTSLLDLNNPNYQMNRTGDLGNDAPVIFKLGGTYNIHWGVVLAGNFQHVTGYPVTASYSVTAAILDAYNPGLALTQGSQTIYAAPEGTYRLPNVNLMDIRISKIFTFHERYKVQPEFDIYNLFNQGIVQTENTGVTSVISGTPAYTAGTIGNLFLNPTNVYPPRLFKIGMRFDF